MLDASSMVASTSPALTPWPSTTLTDARVPVTGAYTGTRAAASTVPGALTVTVRSEVAAFAVVIVVFADPCEIA